MTSLPQNPSILPRWQKNISSRLDTEQGHWNCSDILAIKSSYSSHLAKEYQLQFGHWTGSLKLQWHPCHKILLFFPDCKGISPPDWTLNKVTETSVISLPQNPSIFPRLQRNISSRLDTEQGHWKLQWHLCHKIFLFLLGSKEISAPVWTLNRVTETAVTSLP